MFRLPTLLLAVLLLTGCDPRPVRTVEDFNFDWRFTLGDEEAYSSTDYNDGAWRSLRLPHDWAIEGQFSEDAPATPSGGALPGGIGWYRKHFTAPMDGRIVSLEFDGVFMNSTVWINGTEIGHRPYGYSSFSYDITPYLQSGDNVVAVKCDNSLQPNSRWYAGCGIYRNVRMVVTNPLHVAYSGTCITTPEVSNDRAAVHIVTTITNRDNLAHKATLHHRILDAAGKCIAEATAKAEIAAGATADFAADTEITNPERWAPEHPNLYTVETFVKEQGRTTDNYFTKFGVRDFQFTAEKGLLLNGRPVKLRGVCMHHDLGALGAAVHPRALERQLEILRGMGCNAIRTSHNPPAPELLDLCDRMGFIVMDEAFDMWRKPKTKYDYARYFDSWHERDLTDFIQRDRNHPSVLIWSIGNEIPEQYGSDADEELAADLTERIIRLGGKLPDKADEASNPNILMTTYLTSLVHSLDPTRPVTAGCDFTSPQNNLLRSGALDIVGFNYHEYQYDSIPAWFPGKPFVGSEATSSIQSRGFYLNPSSEQHVQPEHWSKNYETPHHQCSAYDHSYVPWGATHETAWIATRDRNYVAGYFIWTGFDYLGEPTPYTWPSRSSYFGIVDLCGFPKDVYYMYRSEWTDSTTLHLFPHWNWQKGDKIDLWTYYNNADEVELFVNGHSMGKQSKTPERLHCIWPSIPFEPGEITAVSYKNGQEVARDTRRTAGETATLRLTADHAIIDADGYDLAFIMVEALDAAGNPVPTAMDNLQFSVEGAGELAGVDNGNAAGIQCLKGSEMKLFNGRALAVVRSLKGQKGDIRLHVEGQGLSGTLPLSAK